MAQETVAQAIQNLRRALDEGEHTCSMQLEPIGDMTEVAFYLDGNEDEPAGTLTVVNPS